MPNCLSNIVWCNYYKTTIDSCLHFGAAIPEKESGVSVQLILSNDGRTSLEILSSHVS